MIIDYLEEQILQNFGHKPTSQQAELIRQLASFLLSDRGSEAFILCGYAGTGKTSLISALVKTMKSLERHCVLMAPTGRAAKVLSSYAKQAAYTIHKRIYRYTTDDGADQHSSIDYNKMKNTLFIVDEASMIANDGLSGSAFGTGRLLDDLVQYVYSGTGCRLILIGDTAQLPPVGEAESPALQADIIGGYGLQVHFFELTQVVRQENESGILSNATQLRTLHAEDNVYDYPHIDFTKDVRKIMGNELIEKIESCYDRCGTDGTIVICRSNKRANIYNQGIRRQILWREEELESGDMLMVAKNNYYWQDQVKITDNHNETDTKATQFIANGDIAVVERVRNERELYGFRFADCILRLPDYDNMEFEATVLLDTLHAEAPSLTKEQAATLFARVQEDYMHIRNKRERMKELRKDPYYNALQVKYAYAVTCHKAQGGQWPRVFIDQGYMTEDMLGPDYYRWLYTAFTRATEKLYLVNWEEHH